MYVYRSEARSRVTRRDTVKQIQETYTLETSPQEEECGQKEIGRS